MPIKQWQNQLETVIDSLSERGLSSISFGSNIEEEILEIPNFHYCSSEADYIDYYTCDDQLYQRFREPLNNRSNSFVMFHVSVLDRIQHHIRRSKSPLIDIQVHIKISAFIENVMAEMSDNDYLMVTGDHGTNRYGDHGYLGQDQSHTFLFAYSKNKVQRLMKEGMEAIHPDIATTFALIYDIPIPQNSIGVPIFLPEPIQKELKVILAKNNISQSVAQTTLNQFQERLDYAGKDCQYLQKIDPESVSFEQLKQIQNKCLGYQFTDPSVNYTNLKMIVMFMGISYFLMLFGLKVTLLEVMLFGVMCLPYPYRWANLNYLSTYSLFNLLFFVLTIDKARPIQKMKMIGILLFVSQMQKSTASFFLTPNLSYYFQSFWFVMVLSIALSALVFIYLLNYNKSPNRKQKISKQIIFVLVPIICVSQLIKIFAEDKLYDFYTKRIPIIVCNYIITVILLASLVFRILKWRKSEGSVGFFSNINKMDLMICLLSYLSVFNSQYYWLAVISYLLITRACLKFEGRLKGVIVYSLAIYYWCMFGNSYNFGIFNSATHYAYVIGKPWLINSYSIFMYVGSAFMFPLIIQLLYSKTATNQHIIFEETNNIPLTTNKQAQDIYGKQIQIEAEVEDKISQVESISNSVSAQPYAIVQFSTLLKQYLIVSMGLLPPTMIWLLQHNKGSVAILSFYCKIKFFVGILIAITVICLLIVKCIQVSSKSK